MKITQEKANFKTTNIEKENEKVIKELLPQKALELYCFTN